MTAKELDIQKIIDHWKDSSEKYYQTMLNLYRSEDYNWALFLGHLVVEKLLKALYIKNKRTHPILGHDLLRLASNAGLKLTEEQQDWFDRLTTFNINARYDTYKQDFYRLCTREFAEEWKQKIETLREWLQKQL